MFGRQVAPVILLLMALAAAASAATIRVPSDYPTIQAAIQAASKGDTILVAPGVYVESVNLYEFVTLVSESGPEETVIDGGGADDVVHVSNGLVGQSNEWVIDGFTVRGGGIGVAAEMPVPQATTLIANCIIRDNSGPGVWATGHPVTVTDCVIKSNGGAGVGLLHNSGIAPCSVLGSVITDCGVGIQVWCDGCDFIAEHNTIVGNTQGVSLTRFTEGGPGVLSSNIVVGNDWGVCVNQPFDPYDCALIDHNDVWGNGIDVCPGGDCDDEIIGFSGNISANPLFCNAPAGDFTLAEASPCVGGGTGGTNIGALGVGCDEQTGVDEAELHQGRETTWGLVKALFR